MKTFSKLFVFFLCSHLAYATGNTEAPVTLPSVIAIKAAQDKIVARDPYCRANFEGKSKEYLVEIPDADFNPHIKAGKEREFLKILESFSFPEYDSLTKASHDAVKKSFDVKDEDFSLYAIQFTYVFGSFITECAAFHAFGGLRALIQWAGTQDVAIKDRAFKVVMQFLHPESKESYSLLNLLLGTNLVQEIFDAKLAKGPPNIENGFKAFKDETKIKKAQLTKAREEFKKMPNSDTKALRAGHQLIVDEQAMLSPLKTRLNEILRQLGPA